MRNAFLHITSLVTFLQAGFCQNVGQNSTQHVNNTHLNPTLEVNKMLLGGKRLKVLFYAYEPYTSSKETYDGFDYKIFEEFSRRYNYTLNIVHGNWKLDTRRNESIPSYLKKLWKGEYDVVLPGLFITEIRHTYTDISVSYMQSSVHFLTPKPERFQNLWSIFLPFHTNVWFAVLSYVVLSSVIFYLLAIVHHSLDDTYMKGNPYLEYSYCVMGAIGTTVGVGLHTEKSFAIRHALTWCFMAFTLVVTAYNSNLTSFLTVPLYRKPIDTLEEFLESKLQWTSAVENWVNIFQESKDSRILELSRGFTLSESSSVLNKLARSRKFALISEKLESGRICRIKFLESNILSSFYLMKDNVQSFCVGFLFKKNSTYLVAHFNYFLRFLRDSGIIHRWVWDTTDKVLPTDYLLPLKDQRTDDLSLRAISVDEIVGSFVLLLIGLLLSVIALVHENMSYILLYKLFQWVHAKSD